MSSPKNENSQLVKSTHSYSGSTVPMWDSSDPERAPPPLPLNPGSPATRPNASATIQAAAAALAEKSRETVPSPYTSNPMPLKSSPEKSLIKGQYHRRMQSYQPPSMSREFGNYLENRSPERPPRTPVADSEKKLGDTDSSPSQNRKTPTNSGTDSGSETPTMRPSSRYLSKPILGENTPPSATMLALQNVQIPIDADIPPLNVGSNASTAVRQPPSFDALSSQILSLTSIATNLQREMAQLSRRSKDNATDLVSLKAATNARDEDIRKSLRELTSNLSTKFLDPDSDPRFAAPCVHSGTRGYMLDSKAQEWSPSSRKSYSLPRISSPNSFAAAMERELASSPAPYTDGSASIALLEKVLREMATKEGQEKLVELMEELKSRPTDKEADSSMENMLHEVLNLLKENSESRALVRSGTLPPGNAQAGPLSRDLDGSGAYESTSVVTDEVLNTLKRVKNSVAEGGGLTSEVKKLVRELRGEVLGMGREIARQLEEMSAASEATDKGPQGPSKEDITQVVESGLAELKEQMDQLIRDKHSELTASQESRAAAESEEIYNAIKNAIADMPKPDPPVIEQRGSGIEREEILEAVREAWETYKPEIELQNFGLERDEILDCLTEGLQAYQPKEPEHGGATYDQVLEAVQTSLQNYTPPQPQVEPSISRDEIIATIRDCLESFEWPEYPQMDQREPGITRDDVLSAIREGLAEKALHDGENEVTRDHVLSAVKEGLSEHEKVPDISREDLLQAVKEGLAETGLLDKQPEISREDLLEAVKEGLAETGLLDRQPDISRDEILDAFKGALADHGSTDRGLDFSRDDLVEAVKDGFVQHGMLDRQPEVTREELFNAVRDGLAEQGSLTKEIEFNRDDLFEAIKAGLDQVSEHENNNFRAEIIERLHDMVGDMKAEFQQYSAAGGRDTEQVLDAIKDNLEVLRGEIESYVDRASDVTGKDEIVDTVKEGFRLMHSDFEKSFADIAGQISAGRPPDTPELLDAMEKEFEHLRQTMSGLLIRNGVSSDRDEILDAIRDLSENGKSVADNSDISKTIKEEFENLREAISMTMVPANPTSDKEEIIAALERSFETLQAEASHKGDDNETVISNTGELLDAFNQGVDTIRVDMERIMNQPVDAGVSSEVLEALKEGLAGIKSDIEQLRESQKEYEETSGSRGRELMLSNENSIGSDIESLKVLITQLQIKVEAIETSPPAPEPEPDALKKDDLLDILTTVQEVKESVEESKVQGVSIGEAIAKKEDTDALETLLQNTKAKIDELVFPEPEGMAKAEQVEALEALLKETKEAMDTFAARVQEEGSTKADIGTVETLLKDIWLAVEPLQTKDKSGEEPAEDPEKLVKADLQTVEAMIFEVKSQIESLILPDVETLPTKTEISSLIELVSGFKEKMEAENEMTAQAFEARKIEHGGLAEKIEETKFVFEDVKNELKSKLDGSEEGLIELKKVIDSLNESSAAFATADSLTELSDMINREFERSHGNHEAAKGDLEEKDAAIRVKHDETRAAIVVDLSAKIDEKFGEVLAKYEDAQSAIDAKFSSIEERDTESLEHLTSTKGLAEDIKLVIGAMGNSVTETCERMSDDAKTFFVRVDESYTKMEEMHNDVKTHQEGTKEDLEKALAATDRLEGQLNDVHPQLLEQIKEILSIVGQHYEHSQQMRDEIKTDLSTIPSAIPALLPALPAPEAPREIEKYDDTQVHTKLDDLLTHATSTKDSLVLFGQTEESRSQVQEKLNDLLNHASGAKESLEGLSKLDEILEHTTGTKDSLASLSKLDDILDHAAGTKESLADLGKLDEILENTTGAKETLSSLGKLDDILEHTTGAKESLASLSLLNDIHSQVMATSREVSDMMATQSRLMAEDQENKKQEAFETALALERRLAQKERVEEEVVSLQEEKEALFKAVQALKEEKEELSRRNISLSKEVSGLETALHIRREEMQVMEERAEGLERRIVEGVLDHARSLLLSRPNGVQGMMNLKRVPSTASTVTKASTTSTNRERNVLSSGVNMALKRRAPGRTSLGSNLPPGAGKERRILSHSNMIGNRGSNDKHFMLPPVTSGGLTNLKRSHSVKSNYPGRKASWSARSIIANKENEVVKEEEEHDLATEDKENSVLREDDEQSHSGESDSGTERRTSYNGTVTDTMSYVTGSMASTNRSASYGSSANGVVASEDAWPAESEGGTEDRDEQSDSESEYDEDEEGDQSVITHELELNEADLETKPESDELVVYHHDSGLGTDVPSSACAAVGGE